MNSVEDAITTNGRCSSRGTGMRLTQTIRPSAMKKKASTLSSTLVNGGMPL